MSDLLELIFQSCGELLSYLEIEWHPAFGFAIGFALLAIASLLIGLFAFAEGAIRGGLFTASAICGIGAVIALVVGHFTSK